MRAVDVIRRKRDGQELAAAEIDFIIDSLMTGQVSDYQLSALLMAICLRGMTFDETRYLTEAMLRSGATLQRAGGAPPSIDKHSTGGVGDKTSLVVAPVVAAAGIRVPMISGRGLGHTGGTLDKLESIPGFRTDLTLAEARRALDAVGAVMIGQTDEIAPADRKLYALRDVTATVESIPLIAASIMSKKLAEGIDGLVLDVKAGGGAFFKTLEEASHLGELLVRIATEHGEDCVALITSMDQPLGNAIGNGIEVAEAAAVLRGEGPEDLKSICRELTAEMLLLGRVVADVAQGRQQYDRFISSGAGIRKMREIVEAQKGDPRVLDEPARLPRSSTGETVRAPSSGWVASLDARMIGTASMIAGAGRCRMEDSIDPGAGINLHAKLGDPVGKGEGLATIYCSDQGRIEASAELVRKAYTLAPERVPAPELIHRRISAGKDGDGGHG